MIKARHNFGAVVSSNGCILAFGGDQTVINSNRLVSTFEVYKPATKVWAFLGLSLKQEKNFSAMEALVWQKPRTKGFDMIELICTPFVLQGERVASLSKFANFIYRMQLNNESMEIKVYEEVRLNQWRIVLGNCFIHENTLFVVGGESQPKSIEYMALSDKNMRFSMA